MKKGSSKSGRSLRLLASKVTSVVMSIVMAVSLTPLPAYATSDLAAADAVGALQAQSLDAESPTWLYLDSSQQVDLGQDEEAYFVFTAPTSGSYTFYSFDNNDDPVGYLYSDSDYNERIADNDDGGEGSNFKIDAFLSESQTVYLKAAEYSESGCSYKVMVTRAVDDPDDPTDPIPDDPDDPYNPYDPDDPDDPAPTSYFNTPITLDRVITVPEDYYPAATFEFKAPDTAFYTFELQNASNVEAWVDEYEGNSYGGTRTSSASDGTLTIERGITEGATVYLHTVGTNDKEPYTVTVKFSNTQVTTLVLARQSTSMRGENARYYSFKAPESGKYTFSSTGVDVTGSVYSDISCTNSSFMYSGDLDADGFTVGVEKDEVVYLIAQGAAASSSYRITVSDATAKPTKLIEGRRSGAITEADVTYFDFQASSGGVYQFTAKNATEAVPSIRFYKSLSLEEEISPTANIQVNDGERQSYVGLDEGDSIVIATSVPDGEDDGAISYTLQAVNVANSALSPNGTFAGSIPESGYNHSYLKFEARKSATYVFELSDIKRSKTDSKNSAPRLQATLYSSARLDEPKASGYTSWSSKTESYEDTAHLSAALEEGETYYLDVQSDPNVSFNAKVIESSYYRLENWDASLIPNAYSSYVNTIYVSKDEVVQHVYVYRDGVFLSQGEDFKITGYADSEGVVVDKLPCPESSETYTVNLEGIYPFTGTLSFQINVRNVKVLDNYTLAVPKDYGYQTYWSDGTVLYAYGEPVEPDFYLYRYEYSDGVGREVRLVRDQDYTVSYEKRTVTAEDEDPKYEAVSKADLKESGEYRFTVEGKGSYRYASDYSTKKTGTFTVVNGNDLGDFRNNFDVQVDDTTFTAGSNRSASQPEVSVRRYDSANNRYIYLNQSDYSVSYQKLDDDGNWVDMRSSDPDWKTDFEGNRYAHRALVTGKGNYSGERSGNFSIVKIPAENTAKWVSGVDVTSGSFEYSGAVVSPEFVVYTTENGMKKRLDAADYDIVYTNMEGDEVAAADLKEIGDYTITAIGKRDYLGKATSDSVISINPADNDISNMRAWLKPVGDETNSDYYYYDTINYAYTGSPIAAPTVKVAQGDTLLRQGSDYTVEWRDGADDPTTQIKDVGLYKAVVSGVEPNYTGEVTLEIRVAYDNDLSLWNGYLTNYTVGGKIVSFGDAVKPVFTLSLANRGLLVQGEDFTIAKYLDVYDQEIAASDLKDAGTYYAILEPVNSSVYHNKKIMRFQIADGRDISDTSVYTLDSDYENTSYLVGDTLDFSMTISRNEEDLDGYPINLREGTDYEIAYTDDHGNPVRSTDVTKTAGTYYAQAVGKNRYTGERGLVRISVIEQEEDSTISSSWIQFPDGNTLYYFGQATAPNVTVYNSEKGYYLTQGVDYQVSYIDRYQDPISSSHLVPGSYYVKIDGLRDYASGSSTYRPFAILDCTDIGSASWTLDLDQTSFLHTGTAIVPKISLYYESSSALIDSFALVEGTDYDVSYAAYNADDGIFESLNAAPSEIGAYRLTVTAKGDIYTGSKTGYFQIVDKDEVPLDISAWDISLSTTTLRLFDDLNAKPEVLASYRGIDEATLVAGTDYTVSYVDIYGEPVANTSDPGRYYAIIEGAGNYTGKVVRPFTIIAGYDFSKADVYVENSNLWSFGSPVSPSFRAYAPGNNDLSVRLQYGVDFEVLKYIDDHNNEIASNALQAAGNYTAVLVGKGNFANTGEQNYTITVTDGTDLSNWQISAKSTRIKTTGTPIVPSIEISRYSIEDETNVYLTEGADFRISGYLSSTYEVLPGAPSEAGSYYAVVEGMGIYQGTHRVSFSLVDGTEVEDWSAEVDSYSTMYFGSSITPQVAFYLADANGNKTYLTRGTDYEIVGYTDAKGVTSSSINSIGSYRIKVEGRDSYTGERVVAISVHDGYDLDNWYIDTTDTAIAYDFSGMLSKIDVDVKCSTALGNYVHLVEGSDYQVTIEDRYHNAMSSTYFEPNTHYYAKIEGLGNYAGQVKYRSISIIRDDAAVAAIVSGLIAAIPATITADSGASIAAARSAYDQLTDDQRSFVSAADLARLASAETEYANLPAPVDPATPSENVPATTGGTSVVVDINGDGTATVTSVGTTGNSVLVDTVTTPDGAVVNVTAIAPKAFAGTTVKKITLGDSVTTIGASAFANAKNLVTVTLGKNVKSIGKGAFKGCVKLKNITLTKNVKTVGKNAFKGDKNLKKLKVSTTKLTKASCKNMLKGSSVKTVKLTSMSKSVKKKTLVKYKKRFPKKVSKVKLTIK